MPKKLMLPLAGREARSRQTPPFADEGLCIYCDAVVRHINFGGSAWTAVADSPTPGEPQKVYYFCNLPDHGAGIVECGCGQNRVDDACRTCGWKRALCSGAPDEDGCDGSGWLVSSRSGSDFDSIGGIYALERCDICRSYMATDDFIQAAEAAGLRVQGEYPYYILCACGEPATVEVEEKKIYKCKACATPIEARSSDERVKLVAKWSEWFYRETDTFEGELGLQLAYLWPAIIRGTQIELPKRHVLVETLERGKVSREETIWQYIHVMDDE